MLDLSTFVRVIHTQHITAQKYMYMYVLVKATLLLCAAAHDNSHTVIFLCCSLQARQPHSALLADRGRHPAAEPVRARQPAVRRRRELSERRRRDDELRAFVTHLASVFSASAFAFALARTEEYDVVMLRYVREAGGHHDPPNGTHLVSRNHEVHIQRGSTVPIIIDGESANQQALNACSGYLLGCNAQDFIEHVH